MPSTKGLLSRAEAQFLVRVAHDVSVQHATYADYMPRTSVHRNLCGYARLAWLYCGYQGTSKGSALPVHNTGTKLPQGTGDLRVAEFDL